MADEPEVCDVCDMDATEDDTVQLRVCGHTLCEDDAFPCPICEEEGA